MKNRVVKLALACSLAAALFTSIGHADTSTNSPSTDHKKKPALDQFEGKISFINKNNYSVNVVSKGYSSTLYMGRSSKLTSKGKQIAFSDLKAGQTLHLTPGVAEGGILKIAQFDVVDPVVVRSDPVPKSQTAKISGKIENIDPFNGRMTVSTKGRWYSVELPSQVKWKGKGKQGIMNLEKGHNLTVEVEHFGPGRAEAVSIETES
jgi:hypothetical protein